MRYRQYFWSQKAPCSHCGWTHFFRRDVPAVKEWRLFGWTIIKARPERTIIWCANCELVVQEESHGL